MDQCVLKLTLGDDRETPTPEFFRVLRVLYDQAVEFVIESSSGIQYFPQGMIEGELTFDLSANRPNDKGCYVTKTVKLPRQFWA